MKHIYSSQATSSLAQQLQHRLQSFRLDRGTPAAQQHRGLADIAVPAGSACMQDQHKGRCGRDDQGSLTLSGTNPKRPCCQHEICCALATFRGICLNDCHIIVRQLLGSTMCITSPCALSVQLKCNNLVLTSSPGFVELK